VPPARHNSHSSFNRDRGRQRERERERGRGRNNSAVIKNMSSVREETSKVYSESVRVSLRKPPRHQSLLRITRSIRRGRIRHFRRARPRERLNDSSFIRRYLRARALETFEFQIRLPDPSAATATAISRSVRGERFDLAGLIRMPNSEGGIFVTSVFEALARNVKVENRSCGDRSRTKVSIQPVDADN